MLALLVCEGLPVVLLKVFTCCSSVIPHLLHTFSRFIYLRLGFRVSNLSEQFLLLFPILFNSTTWNSTLFARSQSGRPASGCKSARFHQSLPASKPTVARYLSIPFLQGEYFDTYILCKYLKPKRLLNNWNITRKSSRKRWICERFALCVVMIRHVGCATRISWLLWAWQRLSVDATHTTLYKGICRFLSTVLLSHLALLCVQFAPRSGAGQHSANAHGKTRSEQDYTQRIM